MKLKVLAFTLLASVVVSYWQPPDPQFIDKVKGLGEIGRIAQQGLQFRQPNISPDGQWVAFTSEPLNSALWLASVSDLKPMRLAHRVSLVTHGYAWSPDSEKIAFVAGVQVKLINIMTREVASYNTGSPFISRPVFDGEGKLAFVANRDLVGNPVAAAGDLEKVKRLTPKDRPYLVAARPNEEKRIRKGPDELVGENVIVPYTLGPRGEVDVNINGKDVRVTPVKEVGAIPYCFQPALSPDKRKIAFVCSGAGDSLIVCDVLSQKTYGLGRGILPTWSPDSEWVLYMDEIGDEHQDITIRMDFYISHYRGGKRVKLGSSKGDAKGISWRKNNLVAYDEGKGEIVINKMLWK